jgi:hypothetical protein
MMEGKVKSIEKIQKAPEAVSHVRHPSAAVSQTGFDAGPVPQMAGNMAVQQLFRAGAIQAKLSISQPGDTDEQEADRVADHVMRMAEPGSISCAPGVIHRKCAACEAGGAICPKCEEEEKIKRKENSGGTAHASPAVHLQIAALRGGGQPLAPSVRAFFEPRFGRDFSGVRVHTDSQATESAKSIQARAFTAGQDMVFGTGEYATENQEGLRLLAHELTHVVQQGGKSHPKSFIQRQQAGGAPQSAATNTQPQADKPPLTPRPEAERVWYKGVLLADDRAFMHGELRALIARHGLKGADEWMQDRPGVSTVPFLLPGHLGATPALRPKTPLDAIREGQEKEAQERLVPRLLPIAREVYRDKTRPEAIKLLEDFEKQAKANAESTLKANEEQAKAEGIRYGLTSRQVEKIRYHKTGEGPTEKIVEHETKYDMDKESPAGAGLKDAAKVLLERRRDIEKDRAEQSKHLKPERDPYDPKGRILVPDAQYGVIGIEIEKKKTAYLNLRSFLSSQHPILAAFSELDKGTSGLETLAEKGSGPDMAAVIGQEIARKFANINKVREGLKDGGINVWRQPKMVDLTRVQLGTKDDPMKRRLVDDKVESAQPGVLFDLALGVLNVLALLLAAPTGGASLVVAAGVNIAVTAVHVQEYLMQSALSGTAFDKAQAISAEDPSLFWLAVEIVGTGLDVGPAAAALFKGFKTLAPLVRAAQAAAKGEEAVKSLQAVRTAATEMKGAEVAEKIVTQVKNLQKGEAAVLEGAKISSEELKLLQKAGKTAEEAAASGIGKGFKTATGEVNLSKSGHIFSCASPCSELGDKYAKIFAQGGEFNDDFVKLQKRAHDVAQAEKAAKEAKDAKAIAKAVEDAKQIKKEAAALESRIQKAHPQLVPDVGDEAAATALKQAEAESTISKGRLSEKADDLEKLKPVLDKPPAGVDPNDKLWKEYVGYFNDRLEGIKTGQKGVKPPLSWEGYSEFLGKFQRGTKYQEGVLTGLREGKQGPDGQKLFQGMQDPIVESNVAVLEKSGKVSAAGQPVHNFPDQLIVDKATIGPGKTPNIQALSNKSRVWPDKLNAVERASVRTQVVEDATEALTKYGGDITLKRPYGPLKELYNQTVKVGKVTLVYDKSFVKTAELEKLIVDAAKGVKVNGQEVTVIFR